jgi:hypothetical protein
MQGYQSEIVARELPVSALLYDFPLIYALQNGCIPVNPMIVYSLLCGWIVMMTSSDVRPNEEGSLYSSIGRQYLGMLEDAFDFASTIHSAEVARGRGRAADGFNAIRMADEICRHFRMELFSISLSKMMDVLAQLASDLKPPDEGHERTSPLFWYASDGLTALRSLQEHPARFLYPALRYMKEGQVTQLPRPPMLYRDTWIEAQPHVKGREYHHVALAILKEMLFSGHDVFQQGVVGWTPYSKSCPFGEDCIFGSPPTSETEMIVAAILKDILSEEGRGT